MIKQVFFLLMMLLNCSFLFAHWDATEKRIKTSKEIVVACYYFPNYHTRDKSDPRISNQHWENWPEWELVKQAKPPFEGHRQPNVPECDHKVGSPTPRTNQHKPWKGNRVYPYTNTIVNNTPENFKEALQMTKERLLNNSDSSRILTINCWNEWTEGSYLEPDLVHGTACLEAVKMVVGNHCK